ncbi:putative inorganic phosphate cotransporter isoform X2 [Lycorma delicatula]|uniref:putative inorganic phosphate cotransporter isoform X2 n=1 Tax=Lycorma delicatula TaxID=130591 RepID=UPI003F510963
MINNINKNDNLNENTPLIESHQTKVWIPQRYILAVMGFLGVANAYIMRACLSIAITQMVRHDDTESNVMHDPEACPVSPGSQIHKNKTGSSEQTTAEFDWDEETQGIILSAFYFGYIITHIPGGLLAQKFGGKHTLGLGIFSTALFTILTPWVAHQGVYPLVALRFFMGFGEGTTFPALSTLLAQWAPPFERSKMAALVFAGVQIGTVIASALSGIIMQYVPGGWPNVFYFYGAAGLVWFLIWCILCYNDPSSHPFISEEEKVYLQTTIGQLEQNKGLSTPWKSILTSGPVWGLIIAEIGHDWGLYTMVTDLPKYMSDVMHFNIAENGLLSSLPYLVMWFISLSSGVIADWVLKHDFCSITTLRKILATVGGVGPAVGVILASYAGCNRSLVATLFAVGMGLMGFFYASLRVNSLDLSPNFSGTIMALVNGLGSLSGMATPYLIGVLTPNRTLKEWRVVFWIMSLFLIITNFAFLLFGSGEKQPWDEPKPKPDSDLEFAVNSDLNRINFDTVSSKDSIKDRTK